MADNTEEDVANNTEEDTVDNVCVSSSLPLFCLNKIFDVEIHQ